jgi:GNAT superfamily N-acetyltransferase
VTPEVRIRREGGKLLAEFGTAEVRARVFPDGVLYAGKCTGEAADLSAIVRAFRDEFRSILSFDRDAEWNAVLEEAGYRVHRRKAFVERDLTTLEKFEIPFEWEPLSQVGDAAMLAVLDRAAEGDPFEEGEPRDPQREWNELLDYAGKMLDRDLWRIALLDGETVGVVLPQAYDEDPPRGTLAYVAVLPAHRGKGLGRLLHRSGLALLAEAGVQKYVGSSDVRNVPMLKTFEHNGCETVSTQIYYRA